MDLLKSFSNETFIRTGLVLIIITLITYWIAKFCAKLNNYPPGPTPLPLIGNVLMFRNYKKHWSLEIMKISQVYGPVFTLWIGPLPFVFICDLDHARESFTKIEFSGRPETQFGNCYSNEQYKDVAFTDYGRCWESLRRISHTAIRMFAKTKELSQIVDDCVQQTVTTMIGLQKPFEPKYYTYNLFANILGISVFSEKFDINDKELQKFKYCSTDFQTDLGNRLFIYEFIPIARYFMRNPLIKYQKYMTDNVNYARNIYQNHDKTFKKGITRDFTDTLINARINAIHQDKQDAVYFTDDNIPATMTDLFLAGSETTQATFQWILLLMAYYPQYQQKLQDEIKNEIGDRMPNVDDKVLLPYTLAFISETLRFKNPMPIGAFHKTIVNCKLGIYTVPEGTQVVLHQYAIMMDGKHWNEPEQFKPERFLNEHGEFTKNKIEAYMPFGYGRRKCIGDEFAMNDLFLTLVRFMQLIQHYKIELINKSESIIEPDPINPWFLFPKSFQVEFKLKLS